VKQTFSIATIATLNGSKVLIVYSCVIKNLPREPHKIKATENFAKTCLLHILNIFHLVATQRHCKCCTINAGGKLGGGDFDPSMGPEMGHPRSV